MQGYCATVAQIEKAKKALILVGEQGAEGLRIG